MKKILITGSISGIFFARKLQKHYGMARLYIQPKSVPTSKDWIVFLYTPCKLTPYISDATQLFWLDFSFVLERQNILFHCADINRRSDLLKFLSIHWKKGQYHEHIGCIFKSFEKEKWRFYTKKQTRTYLLHLKKKTQIKMQEEHSRFVPLGQCPTCLNYSATLCALSHTVAGWNHHVEHWVSTSITGLPLLYIKASDIFLGEGEKTRFLHCVSFSKSLSSSNIACILRCFIENLPLHIRSIIVVVEPDKMLPFLKANFTVKKSRKEKVILIRSAI